MDWRGKSFEWFAALPLGILGLAGCCTPGTGQTTAINKDREKDAADRATRKLEGEPVQSVVARSQAPTELPPLAPAADVQVRPAAALAAPAVSPRADLQTRIVAIVGGKTPIYDREVRESMAERASEYHRLSGAPRAAKEAQLYRETLKRLIERELIIDEMFTTIGKSKDEKVKDELQKLAAEDAEKRVKEFRRKAKVDTEEQFAKLLEAEGVSLAGWKRKFEREFLKRFYLQQLIRPKMNVISLADVRDYYDRNPDKFRVEDGAKWNDIYISKSKFADRAEALRHVQPLLEHVRAGEDFAELCRKYDHGDAKFRGGAGAGERRGEIRPPECEEAVFALKKGESTLVEMENGFHIVKLAERVEAGVKPFGEKVQSDIRDVLMQVRSDQEYQRIADALWRKNPPQILYDAK